MSADSLLIMMCMEPLPPHTHTHMLFLLLLSKLGSCWGRCGPFRQLFCKARGSLSASSWGWGGIRWSCGRCLHPDTPGLVWGQDSGRSFCMAAALTVLDFSVSVVGITVNKLYEKLGSIWKCTVGRLPRRGHVLLNIKDRINLKKRINLGDISN